MSKYIVERLDVVSQEETEGTLVLTLSNGEIGTVGDYEITIDGITYDLLIEECAIDEDGKWYDVAIIRGER